MRIFIFYHQPEQHVRIAADINIPCIEQALEGLGELRRFDSRNMNEVREALRGADALLCRSTLRVNDALLNDSNVRFVATATAGTEHIDMEALRARGVVVASAAGSNARSVAEWVAAALLRLATVGDLMLAGASIGIVGVGHVGTQVFHLTKALGLRHVLNDPPRELRGEKPIQGENIPFEAFDRILDSDIVTLHVPLERNGPFPTYRMMDIKQFHQFDDGGVFINTARGDVMAADACLLYADQGNDVLLDVYPDEPTINPELVRRATIATAHIAGHSYDGKLLGTQMVYDALFEWMGRVPRWRHEAYLPEAPVLAPISGKNDSPYHEVSDVVRAVYDIAWDAGSLLPLFVMPPETAVAHFEKLRAEYPIRREFHRVTVKAGGISNEAATIIGNLGFRLDSTR